MPFQFPSGGSGTFVMGEAEIDFGPLPVPDGIFIITEAATTPTSSILTKTSRNTPTGKDADEIDMDNLQTRAIAGTGQFSLYVTTADGSYLADKFKIDYIVE